MLKRSFGPTIGQRLTAADDQRRIRMHSFQFAMGFDVHKTIDARSVDWVIPITAVCLSALIDYSACGSFFARPLPQAAPLRKMFARSPRRTRCLRSGSMAILAGGASIALKCPPTTSTVAPTMWDVRPEASPSGAPLAASKSASHRTQTPRQQQTTESPVTYTAIVRRGRL